MSVDYNIPHLLPPSPGGVVETKMDGCVVLIDERDMEGFGIIPYKVLSER